MAGSLPPLNALRAFEAAARQLSFTRAARELHVTQTAISHQMRLLETHLGVRLFQRLPRRLVLTADGQAYARELGRVFERIDDATIALRRRPSREVLAITALPSFAARWLVPRLPSFLATSPGIDLRLQSTEQQVDFARDPVDVGIRFGYGRYAGLRTEGFMGDASFPVCSPSLMTRRRGKSALDLRRHALLHDDSPDGWRRWLRASAVTTVDPERGHVFTDASLMLQAAVEGQGVAMGRRVLVERDLAAGRLVRAFPSGVSLPTDQAYYLVTSDHTAELPKVKAFCAWIRSEAGIRNTSPGDPTGN